MKSGQAFTLAEVLITLGIIGIVAAMTMPVLIANHRKTVIETRLKKFYSSINQAIALAENEFGDRNGWIPTDTEDFWNNYLAKHLKYTKTENVNIGTRTIKNVYFEDGSAVFIDIYDSRNAAGDITNKTNGGHFRFCPEAKYCTKEYIIDNEKKYCGTKFFVFGFWPNEQSSQFKYHRNKGVEPYYANWDGNNESLYTSPEFGCNTSENSSKRFCTALIQQNGWEIPKDYPFRL